jgi:opacity protein-like surface antigen
MKRFLFAAGVFALVVASVAVADDPKPTQPPTDPAGKGVAKKARPVESQPDSKGNPWAQSGFTRVTPARMATMEEEVQTLEAQRDVRKAYVRAAEVGVKGAEVNLDRIARIGAAGVVTREETDKAKLDVEAAKAQLDIRMAEMKEIEVKIKFAKKRLEDAKAAPPRGPGSPAPARVNPRPVDPPPPPRSK